MNILNVNEQSKVGKDGPSVYSLRELPGLITKRLANMIRRDIDL